jgi:hypothetical protein
MSANQRAVFSGLPGERDVDRNQHLKKRRTLGDVRFVSASVRSTSPFSDGSARSRRGRVEDDVDDAAAA